MYIIVLHFLLLVVKEKEKSVIVNFVQDEFIQFGAYKSKGKKVTNIECINAPFKVVLLTVSISLKR